MTTVRAGNLTRYIGGQLLGVGSVRTRVDPVSGLPVADIGIGSGLGLRVQGGVAPVAAIAGLDLDFASGRYALNGPYVADIRVLSGWSFARDSVDASLDSRASPVLFARNVPRITDMGLAIDEARINLVVSGILSGPGWSATGATIANGSAWGTKAGRMIGSTGAMWNRASLSGSPIPVTANASYAVSCVYRAGSSGRIRVSMRDEIAKAESYVEGPVGNATGITASAGAISKVTNEMIAPDVYRLTFVLTPNTANPRYIGVGPASAVPGQTVEGLAVQVEAGAYATGLIPTPDVAASRSAEAVSLGDFGATMTAPFVMFGEWTVGAVPTGSTALMTQFKGPTLGVDPTRVKVSYPGVADIVSINAVLPVGSRNRLAGRFKPGDYAVSLNGTVVTSKDARAVAATDRIQIGQQARFLNGYIRRLRIIPGDMTDAQLRDLTA